jgi:hypothetical protein
MELEMSTDNAAAETNPFRRLSKAVWHGLAVAVTSFGAVVKAEDWLAERQVPWANASVNYLFRQAERVLISSAFWALAIKAPNAGTIAAANLSSVALAISIVLPAWMAHERYRERMSASGAVPPQGWAGAMWRVIITFLYLAGVAAAFWFVGAIAPVLVLVIS